MARHGRLFVISAPSGAGKTTLIRQVTARFPGVSYSVSHTTRPPRPGEIDGKDYFFISRDRFEQMIQAGEWLEWACVHGNWYGTSRAFVQKQLEAGKNLLLDIDVQGARQIMASGLDTVSVFIMPPSLEVLRQRLENRGTDSERTIALRLENARQEIIWKHLYHHVLVNDDLDTTAAQLCTIFAQEMTPEKERPDSGNA
ncbi:MAG: guanylate kinase [Desulfotignum sp.]|nr:guanylate kinase [Desulfotignum sp.]MCF8112632.1 guanylate kinase [Desulfotignum sp.]MCF8124808.1 guanylate kinase [Desulfotignum sp.]